MYQIDVFFASAVLIYMRDVVPALNDSDELFGCSFSRRVVDEIMHKLLGCCSPLRYPPLDDHPTRPQVTSDEIEELFRSRSLAVLSDVTKGWHCRKWNEQWCCDHLGHLAVDVSYRDACGNSVSSERDVLLKHFLENHTDKTWTPAGTRPAVDSLDIMAIAPELREQCPSEQLFGPDRNLILHGAFIGAAGSSTRMHVDSEDNLIFCAFGRKLFILLPPSATELIEFSARGIPIENPLDPNVEEKARLHPMFRKCASLVRAVVLSPGDLLVQPRGWSHWVYNLELSLSIACWAKACPPPVASLDGAPPSHIVIDDSQQCSAAAERV